ncbi:helix-turn-helix domain-containing protein [Nocardia sp. NBC_00508]|uniref:helix-turn-helix domain-containing protein n=1 Tax=Nocardia sp. NBC_00508 TaxID=2975992 RepID=UPI002E80B81D|nr:helix-turn-helix transcriptional regulator [Nocardia sp. NBC_00508]WUD68531.1 helix-turn-helix domain-containing protein [Nocardia sp. NBC_00508]
MSETGSTLPRRQLGRYMREWRQRSNLTIVRAAELMEWSESTLQRIETGNAEKVRWRDVKELCDIYGMDGELTAALIGLAKQANVKSWYHEYGDLIPENFNLYVGLESSAKELTVYQPDLVPGLLQTPEYAHVLARGAYPNDTPEQLAGRVQIKMHRQSLITRSRQPVILHVVIHEAVLRRIVGGPQVMGAQCRHLADRSTLPNISIRLLPFSAGAPLGAQLGPYVILVFGIDAKGKPVEPTVVYQENYLGDLYMERPIAVERYHQAHAALQDLALSEVESRDRFRQMAREYAL